MRILAVTNLYPNPYEPDRATFNRQQFRALVAEHPVRVISPISWIDSTIHFSKGDGRLPRDRRVTCDGIVVDHPRYWYTPRMLRRWYGTFFQKSIRPTFDRALDEFAPELILGAWAYPDGWAAVALGHRAGLPVVIKVHGSDVLGGGKGLDRYPSRRGGTAEALRRADGVIAVSEDLAERVVALGAERRRVRVIYDGINADLFHPGPRDEACARLGLDPDEPIIVFIGALREVKAVDVLIDACAQLVGDGVKFRCFLIGNGPLGPSLEEQVERLGLRDTVRLMGPRPHGQLPDWYRAATVFALPSRSEGVPCVLLEAIACGVPFVASRVGGIPEIAHLGTGRLVPPGDATALAQALAASFDATPSTGQPIRSHAEAANEIAGFFEEVLGQRRSLATACGEMPIRQLRS